MSISNTELKEAAVKLGNDFKVFPLRGKKPAIQSGFHAATSNTTQLTEWFSDRYEGCNIGIPTGSASKLIAIDVDQKPGQANGMHSLMELERVIGPLPNTVTQITGTGRHLIYRYDGDDIPCSVGKLGPGLDVRGEGGYIVVAPSIHPDTNTPYMFADGRELTLDALAPAPEPLLKLLRRSDQNEIGANIKVPQCSSIAAPANFGSSALAAECVNIRSAPCGQQEAALNKAVFAIGQLVGGGSIDYQEAVLALIEAGMAMTNCNIHQPWTKSEISKKVAHTLADGMKSPRRSVPDANSDAELDALVAELNQNHAVVMMGGKCLVLNETKPLSGGSTGYSFSSFSDFKNRYCTRAVKVGKSYQKLGHAWLEHPNRRSYEQVVFDPANRSNGAYNLWQGFAVDAVKGSCTLFLGHIRNIIAAGNEEVYEYILNFMADAVQNPAVRPGVALVLRGGPGTGKGVFVHNFGRLFGRHFLRIDNPHNLLGNFNRELEDKLVVFADEAFWAGDKAAEGRLKGLITEPTITIEMKGVDSYTVPNYIRLIVATNEEWAVPAMSKDRRYCVLDVSDERQQDREYFAAIANEMDNGGREALLHFLLNRSIDGTDIAKFPKTKALEDQKRLSLSLIDQWFMDCLERGCIDYRYSWDKAIPTSVAFAAFDSFCRNGGQRHYMFEATFGKAMKGLVPSLTTRRLNVDSRAIDDRLPLNGRVRHYILSPLEMCRQHFEKTKGITLDIAEE
jgi:hypothetical protein